MHFSSIRTIDQQGYTENQIKYIKKPSLFRFFQAHLYKENNKQKGPLEKGMMWSYSKQRQPWQLQKRLQTMLPAASLRHRSGWRPGTVSALAQHMLFALVSKNLGLSSTFSLRALRGDDEPDSELILCFSLEWRRGKENVLRTVYWAVIFLVKIKCHLIRQILSQLCFNFIDIFL